MGIYWKNIDPQLQVLGALQQINFSNIQNLTQFQINNTFVPTSLVPSQNLFELRNSGLSGFRFRHETAFGDTHGTLKIQSFLNGQTTGTDLMTFNQDGTITLDAGLVLDDLNFTKLGIGADPVDDGTIKFSNANNFQKKIILWDINGNSYQYAGFGIDGANVLYQTTASHLFLIGTSPTTFYCGLSINSSGNVGLGNYQSATSSRLFINGGPTLDAAGEESAIRVQNSNLSSSTIKIQLVHQNAKNWELRSNSNGSFEIYDRFGLTSRFLMQGTGATTLNGSLTINNTGVFLGNLGVGISNPTNAKVQTVSGVQNVSGEDTAIRVSSNLSSVKIELENTSVNGRLYELRSNSDGSFGIFDRTSNALRLGIDASGSISGNFASGLGQNVALPFAQLNFNWANVSGGTPYIFNHAINDSAPFFKQHIYQVTSVSPDVQRKWQALYSLGDPNAWNPEYSLTFYHPLFSPGGTTPFQLLNIGGGFSPVWGLYIRATMDMGGFEIKNALNPTTAQSLATKNYIDTRRLDQFVAPTSALNINSQALNSVSSIAIGAASATLGSLFIQGGVVSGSEDAAIYLTSSNLIHSITMQNTNALGGRTFKIRNNANGSLDFFDQNALTPRLTIDSSGNALFSNTIYGRRVSGLMTMQGNAIGTTVTTGGLFYKVAGTTASSSLNGLSMPVSNRLTWTSATSGVAIINFYLTASHNGAGGNEIQFSIYKNGIQIANSIISGEDSANRLTAYSLGTIIAMALNDYIELYCSHPANGKIITVKNMICNFSTT